MLGDIRQAEPWTFMNILGLIVLIAIVAVVIWLILRVIARK
ncbi:MAG: hypothetical protein ACE5MI_09560 [Acidimicrobiia bacterium]